MLSNYETVLSSYINNNENNFQQGKVANKAWSRVAVKKKKIDFEFQGLLGKVEIHSGEILLKWLTNFDSHMKSYFMMVKIGCSVKLLFPKMTNEIKRSWWNLKMCFRKFVFEDFSEGSRYPSFWCSHGRLTRGKKVWKYLGWNFDF